MTVERELLWCPVDKVCCLQLTDSITTHQTVQLCHSGDAGIGPTDAVTQVGVGINQECIRTGNRITTNFDSRFNGLRIVEDADTVVVVPTQRVVGDRHTIKAAGWSQTVGHDTAINPTHRVVVDCHRTAVDVDRISIVG